MQYLVEFELNIPDGESEYERNLFRSDISAPRRQGDHTGVSGKPFFETRPGGRYPSAAMVVVLLHAGGR